MGAPAELLGQLSANRWFGALPLAQRRAMLAAASLAHFRAGEMLFRRGDPAGRFYCVISGVLKASTLLEDGKEAILSLLEPGNWFGEISLLDDQPRTHDMTALGDAQVLVLPRDEFDALMGNAVFARAMAMLLASRIRMLYSMVEDATLRSTRARVARRLLALARGDVSMSSASRTVLPVSQEALAMMLGITRQTLSKELKVLVAQGALALRYGCMEITSLATLETLGAAG
ncbi:MAG: Crp/Fnr family transcriptional regulator [Rhodoferax sp.]|nr:Crp/Fnr family transcriptional regulator [Rhodoferax sp.]